MLSYCGVRFELDIYSLCKCIDDKKEYGTSRLNGAWGHPSDVGWNAPEFSKFFAGMTDEEIAHWVCFLVDGQTISDFAIPGKHPSDRIRMAISSRDKNAPR